MIKRNPDGSLQIFKETFNQNGYSTAGPHLSEFPEYFKQLVVILAHWLEINELLIELHSNTVIDTETLQLEREAQLSAMGMSLYQNVRILLCKWELDYPERDSLAGDYVSKFKQVLFNKINGN